MNLKPYIILALLACLLSIAINVFWLFNRDDNATVFVEINIGIAVFVILLVIIQAIQQRFEK